MSGIQSRSSEGGNGELQSVEMSLENTQGRDNALSLEGGNMRKNFAVSTRWEEQMAGGTDDPILIKPKCYRLNKIFCWCSKPLGGMFILCQRRNGDPLMIAGPLWGFCMFITVPLILFISGVFLHFVVMNDKMDLPLWVQILYIFLIAFTLICLFFTSCRNPGLIERTTDEEAGRNGWYWNEQTGAYRPPNAMYCRECKVLIEGYDHLCPWTGTGIGKGNMIPFRLFVLFVNCLCYATIILAFVAFLL